MRFIPCLLTACRAGILLAVSFAGAAGATDTIKVGGTGSGLGVMKILRDAFEESRPDVRIVVVPSLSSSGGIKAAAEGVLDIGLSGRPLKAGERAYTLTGREIARTPLVLASMKAHAGFTTQDIVRVYEGTLNAWPDGRPLRPVMRPESDSETALLRAMSPAHDRALSIALARPGIHIAITDQDTADAIERIPGALGTTTLAMILSEARAIKALPLNGVVPSVATLASGRYPYYKPLYVFIPPTASRAARDFLAFVESAQGARILADNGYLALPPTE